MLLIIVKTTHNAFFSLFNISMAIRFAFINKFVI